MNGADLHYLVVGGGHAAGQLLDSVRRFGFSGKLTLVTEEDMLPYQRPHLSKLYLSGKLDKQKLLYRPEEFYSDNNINVIRQQSVTALDPEKKEINLANGETMQFDKLALTTGASVRKLDIPGSESKGVFYLRSVKDTDQIRSMLDDAAKVVLIGGGFLGLEAASVITALGKKATVIEVADRVMSNTVAREISGFYENLHQQRGVEILLNTRVDAIESKGNRVTGVTTSDGQLHDADLVIISVGIVPNTSLAVDADIKCKNGILVDEFAVTSHPDIVAAGDCTNHPNSFIEKNIRLESVHNAVEQAKTAAASLCGIEQAYRQIPWFWSDQYEYRLQMTGIPGENDQIIVRGLMATGKFSVLFFDGDRLTACQAVNLPGDYMCCRKILENRIKLTPQQAAQPGFDLQSVIPGKTRLAFQKRDQQPVG